MFKFNDKKTFFVTTAIDYPNSDAHLGHAYEKTVADAQARWHRLKGQKVFFLTGTDEHGQKLQRAAEKAGKTPQRFVDEQAEKYKALCRQWNISFDRFIRTTDADHIKICQEIFQKVNQKGDIYLGHYEGLYCVPCETFYTEKDLENGNCPIHHRPVENVQEPTYFFKLSQYQERLLQFYEKNPSFIQPESKKQEIINRVKEGLKDLSVSRVSFSWGIPLPNDPKHVLYVWFDALLNYYTATREKKELNAYWPADIHNIGKDIAWFHCVIWPCILFAADIAPPKTVFIHGFINTESGEKLSKTTGTRIDPVELAERFGTDQLRYFLLREIPFGQDGTFSIETLQSRVNNELANGLGNLLNRTVNLAEKKLNGKITKQKTDAQLAKALELEKITELNDAFSFHLALGKIFDFVNACNKYVNDQRPWEQNEKDAAVSLYNLVDALRVLAILLEPFIPESSGKINEQIGVQKGTLKEAKLGLLGNTTIRKGAILFSKIELTEAEKQKPETKAREIQVIVEDTVSDLGLKVVSGIVEGIRVKKKHEGLEKLKEKTAKEVKRKDAKRQAIIAEYEHIYQKLRVKNAINSVRNLDALVEQSGQLPQINTAVDCYNIVSLRHGLVVGCHDIDKLTGNIGFMITNGTETYIPLGSNENKGVAKGEFAVIDGKQVVCRLDEKQCDETKVTNETKHAVFYVQGNSKTPRPLLEQARDEIGNLIAQYCGGKYKPI